MSTKSEESLTLTVSLTSNKESEVTEVHFDANSCQAQVANAQTNKILLYVDANNQDEVRDMIKIALSQGNFQNTDLSLEEHEDKLTIDSSESDVFSSSSKVNADSSKVDESTADQNDYTPNSKFDNLVKSLTEHIPTSADDYIHPTDDNTPQTYDVDEQKILPPTDDKFPTSAEAANTSMFVQNYSSSGDNTADGLGVMMIEMPTNRSSAVVGVVEGEFHVGDEFYSLEDIEENLKIYEERTDSKLYKRDVRSIEALIKRSQKLQRLEYVNEKLKYGQLLFCCVYGGKRKAQKMACVDQNGQAHYTDCKMSIRFGISEDGMKLIVNKIIEEHCHEKVVSDQENVEPVNVMNKGNATELKLGAAFVDLDALYDVVHQYEQDNHIHLWKRDGRTVEALAKRAPGTARKIMETNPGLRFAELRFCCSHGGRSLDENKFKADAGYRQGCEMHIRFGISEDGSQLVVKSMSEQHNHEINEDIVVKEALHPELCAHISRLVWKDVRISSDEVKKHLETYVINNLFSGKEPPPRTRRQYFPTKKQIRYFMAKARSALQISPEMEEKYAALEEKLKYTHPDEKMIFNSLVKKKEIETESESIINNGETQASFISEDDYHILFCHQTPYQQRLLKRYGSQVILVELNNIHSKIPFPLFCLYVQTNVDCQLVGEFIIQVSNETLLAACLSTFKEWNPGWTPKFFMIDYNEDQLSAAELVFPDCFVTISSMSREKEWSDWIDSKSDLKQHKFDIMTHLKSIASSFSEETLNEAAKSLEDSEVWKSSDALRTWFQTQWLAQAKRWVIGYRPDDYFDGRHCGRTLLDETKMFKIVKSVNKSSPMCNIVHSIVEHIVPQSKKQYEVLNQESIQLQRELFYSTSTLPSYLAYLPGSVTKHIYERMLIANSMELSVNLLHPGVFSVEGGDSGDELHTVSFGDHASFPTCECSDWMKYKLPCIHFAAVFNMSDHWKWDMMSVVYRSNPVINVDWSTLKQESEFNPGFLVDRSVQTTDPSSLFSSNGRIKDKQFSILNSENSNSSNTTQNLASQCRALLNQIARLPIYLLNRENLSRIKSDLNEIALTCSKNNLCNFTPIASKNSFRKIIKLNNSHLKTSSVRTILRQSSVADGISNGHDNAGARTYIQDSVSDHCGNAGANSNKRHLEEIDEKKIEIKRLKTDNLRQSCGETPPSALNDSTADTDSRENIDTSIEISEFFPIPIVLVDSNSPLE